MTSLLTAPAVAAVVAVAVLAATAAAAGASYIPTPPLAAGFLFSPPFLWIAANVIVIWLFSSSRCRNTAAAEAEAVSSSAGADDAGEMTDAAAGGLYSSSEYEAYSDVDSVRRAEAVVSRRQAREARAARRADRPRVRKKPAGDDETTPAVPVVEEAQPNDGGDDDDVTMDAMWQSIQRRAARPVAVRKSESWGNHELPQLQRLAETAAARREIRKSVSAVGAAAAASPPESSAGAVPPATRQTGWRTRDVLETFAPDELLRRAESFIRRQHENLRLQRQESEQRKAFELQRRLHHAPMPIRV